MSRKESLNNDINNISKAIHLLLVSIFGISAWGFVNYESLGYGKISLLFIVACLLCAAEYIIIKKYKKLNKELENLWVFWYLLLLLLFFFLVFFCWFLEYKKHKSLRCLLLVKKHPRTGRTYASRAGGNSKEALNQSPRMDGERFFVHHRGLIQSFPNIRFS